MYKDSQLGNPLAETPHDYKPGPLSSDLSAIGKLNHGPKATGHLSATSKSVSPIDAITPSSADNPDRLTNEQERAELEAVLATETFRRSPKLSRLLSYLCNKYFAGEANGLKEYCIAVDVLGRDSEFDPQLDAAVRVDTHYLRKRLKECYAGEARDHQVQIVLPKGQYIPQFLLLPESGTSSQAVLHEEAEPIAPESPKVATGDGAEHETSTASKWRWLAPALGVAAMAVLLVTALRLWHTPGKTDTGIQNTNVVTAATRVAPATTTPVLSASLPESEAIRVLAGDHSGNYVDKEGRVWLPDRYVKGGTTFKHGSREILRTEDPDIFRNGREGQFVYEIPLKPGTYELHLYFAETEVNGEGLRNVGLSINGLPVSTLDVASDAGGVNTATEKVLKDISPEKDGILHLSFQGAGPSGFVNALEILPAPAGKMLPIRLTTQDIPYRDHLGQMWIPDQYFLSGRRSSGKFPIEGTADPALYKTHRFGNFTYSIPVVEGGRYTITLHFAETWFSSPESLGGVGSRVFDVYCNGQTLLKDFDILKDTGGMGNRAVIKTFHHIPASGQGKLNLTFAPTTNYALVSAIEITEE